MFEVVVAIWLKTNFISYALPHQFISSYECNQTIEELSKEYKANPPALRIGFRCSRFWGI